MVDSFSSQVKHLQLNLFTFVVCIKLKKVMVERSPVRDQCTVIHSRGST